MSDVPSGACVDPKCGGDESSAGASQPRFVNEVTSMIRRAAGHVNAIGGNGCIFLPCFGNGARHPDRRPPPNRIAEAQPAPRRFGD